MRDFGSLHPACLCARNPLHARRSDLQHTWYRQCHAVQEGEAIASEYNLGQYSKDEFDLDNILIDGTGSGVSSKYVKQARTVLQLC